MAEISEKFHEVKGTVMSTLQHYYTRIQHNFPESLETSWSQYVQALRTTTKDQIVSDIQAFKLTPATATVTVATLAMGFLATKLVMSGSEDKKASKSKSKHKHKKVSKVQKVNKEIQKILDHVEETFVPQIDEYIDNYSSLPEDDQEYKAKYFEEMLLKELMKLDELNVAGNEVLRDNRKKVIRFIQDHQKRLDAFRKSVQ